MNPKLYLLPASIALTMAVISCTPSDSPGDTTTSPRTSAVAEQAVPSGQPFRIVGGDVVADIFNVRHELRGDQLTMVLDTDLGDPGSVMVSVSRSYWEQGNDEEFPISYFSQRSNVGALRNPLTINLDNDSWKTELDELQRTFARIGEPFTVARISEDISISFTFPVNQDPPLRSRNENLRGSAVPETDGLRVIRWEAEISYPIDGAGIGQTQFADRLNLEVGVTYRGDRSIPLVPLIEPADPIAAIAAIQQMDPDSEFLVLEVATRRDVPWYRVQASLGEGWINSIALIGQELSIVR